MSNALSEKAKGKRRAVDVEPGGGSESGPSDAPTTSKEANRTFTVRFSEGAPDLEMTVSPNDTVREVQRRIREARPSLERRRLRLIHAGRLLTPGTLLHGWLASLEDKQLNSSKRLILGGIGEKAKPKPAADAHDVWIHCSIGPEIPESELEDDKVQAAQITPLRGFDRLTAAGFSPEDIANVRAQFHSSRDANRHVEEDGALQQTEDSDEHARALEEQWIDDMDAGSADASLTETGVFTTFLQGLLLGFFFPVLPFFYMRSPRPDAFFSDEYQALEPSGTGIFSRRMMMAICFGFLSNVAYGALRWFSI